MLRPRVIPCLLLRNSALVKTVRFAEPRYVGDPVNAVHIFNGKEVDELIFLDITASTDGRPPPFAAIEAVANECFMPITYGGGLRTTDAIGRIFAIGVEKVSVNSGFLDRPELVREAADRFGSQSIVVSIDARSTPAGYRVTRQSGRQLTDWEPQAFAVEAQRMGAGEILLTSIDRDGTMEGYDVELTASVAAAVDIPLVACGGAGNLGHLREVLTSGHASAAAAGSMFVYHGRNRAVLVNFPAADDLQSVTG